MSNDAVEAAWTELTAPQNETVTSKWYFKKGYEAATKAALGTPAAKIVGPSDHEIQEKIKFGTYINTFEDGAIWYRDNIKLVPLSVDEILPSHDDFVKWVEENKIQILHTNWGELPKLTYDFIRESIKKRLGGM